MLLLSIHEKDAIIQMNVRLMMRKLELSAIKHVNKGGVYMDGFQALQAGTVRPPEGKPAASKGAGGEVRGSRSSLLRMRDMDPPEVPLRQAPYNTPQDVASNSRSLVQVAEQAHPLVQRCPSPNPMREHRNNRTHEEVVVGGGATSHG